MLGQHGDVVPVVREPDIRDRYAVFAFRLAGKLGPTLREHIADTGAGGPIDARRILLMPVNGVGDAEIISAFSPSKHGECFA